MTRSSAPACVHIHGVSVGEILSVAPLIETLRRDQPQTPLLLTCWTPTSLALAHKNYDADRLITIERLPIDLPWNRFSFLRRHNIAVSLWVDSEIWPGWLRGMKKHGIAVMIVNGRMSEQTCKRWSMVKPFAKWVFGHYARIDAQSRQDAQFFNTLGAKAEVQPVNLKYLRPPTPVAQDLIDPFLNSIAARPVVMHAMTHPGEELWAFEQHVELKKQFPNLLTISVPRHVHRSAELAGEAQRMGLKTQIRSESQSIDTGTDIFFGDTIGETGLYYALSRIAVMGKSFDPDHIGGQSPIEAAYSGCAIVCGPYMTNFPAIMEDLVDAQAVSVVPNLAALQTLVAEWLQNPEKAAAQGRNAKAMIAQKIEKGPSYLANIVEFINTKLA